MDNLNQKINQCFSELKSKSLRIDSKGILVFWIGNGDKRRLSHANEDTAIAKNVLDKNLHSVAGCYDLNATTFSFDSFAQDCEAAL